MSNLTLEGLKAAFEQIQHINTLWYVVTHQIPDGKVFLLPTDGIHPDVWLFSRSAFAEYGAELSTYRTMRDFRLWQASPEQIDRAFREAIERLKQ